jgi:DnaJ domain
MPYLILGVALLIGFVLLAQGITNVDPRSLARTLKWSGAALSGALVGYLLVTRQIEWALSAVAVTLPLLLRWGRWSPMRGGFGRPGGRTRSSNVETRFLRMNLDHATGTLDGVVLSGAFAGRKLSELGESELMELLRECRVGDDQSASVLEAYLDRTHGADWRRADPGGGTDTGSASGGRRRRGPQPASAMTRDEAYKVLGLERGATPDEIKEAHRRLMRHCHPDMGGSDYLAARVNEAKDVLLDG